MTTTHNFPSLARPVLAELALPLEGALPGVAGVAVVLGHAAVLGGLVDQEDLAVLHLVRLAAVDLFADRGPAAPGAWKKMGIC